MKSSLLLLALFVSLFSTYSEGAKNKYDNVNLDMILQNQRVLTNYIKCLMDEGPCTAEGRQLKRTLPDALTSGCSKCDEKQKQAAEKVIHHLMNKRAKDFQRLATKYDPKGDYKKRYQATTIKN